jgi:hypothetical protein
MLGELDVCKRAGPGVIGPETPGTLIPAATTPLVLDSSPIRT